MTIEDDQELEAQVIRLLGRSQRVIEPFDRTTRPERALAVLEKQVNEIAALADRLPVRAFPNAVEKALAVAAKAHPQAALVQVANNRVDLRTVSGLYLRWKGKPAGRTRVVRDVVAALVIVIDRLLTLIVFQFRSAELMDDWTHTYSVFLQELRQALAPVPF